MNAYKIVRTGDGYREVIDEFETLTEARAMLSEYRTADPSAAYRLRYPPASIRNIDGWHERAARHDN